MRKSFDVLTSHHSHTSSIPPALSSSVTLHVPIQLWTTVELLGLCGAFAKGVERPIRLTTSHLALDCWIQFSNTQHWSGNCLSSSAESSSLEHARRNGNVQHRTSHTMMTMMSKEQDLILLIRVCSMGLLFQSHSKFRQIPKRNLLGYWIRFPQAGYPSCSPTNSIKALNEKYIIS